MNPNVSQLNSLHKTYLRCVDTKMTDYLSNAQARSENKDTEFCASEKHEYLGFMKSAFPEQFTNVMRVEANTYWSTQIEILFKKTCIY